MRLLRLLLQAPRAVVPLNEFEHAVSIDVAVVGRLDHGHLVAVCRIACLRLERAVVHPLSLEHRRELLRLCIELLLPGLRALFEGGLVEMRVLFVNA